MSLRNVAVASLAGLTAVAGQMTCGDLKDFYKGDGCCGNPSKALSSVPGATPCPYNFNKPACADAEPQAPRDLTSGATGMMDPKAAVLTKDQTKSLPLVNVHFHLGAEHKSEFYMDGTDAAAYDAGRRLAAGKTVRPGFMCETTTAEKTSSYVFQHCKGQMEVGKSYEVHYVHSSAGYTAAMIDGTDMDGIEDGLGGAANGRGLLNPMVTVQGQVYHIVEGGPEVDDLLHGWTVTDESSSVMYAGSTTGQSHDNDVCSPYAITWHVDKKCHKVSPASFDKLCKDMKDLYNLEADLYPHGSRLILDPKWVVKEEHVKPLA